MNWTKEQREAIKIRDKSILVSAAAGSGKTAVLVERIKQILTDEAVNIDEILVLTFTNAAASEMREKIVASIPDQIDMIQKSQIGTFHSFALDIIGRYFHLINLEPGFSVCDESRKILLEKESMDQLFEERFESEDCDFLEFLKMYASSKSEENVRAMINTVYSFVMSMADPFQWLARKVQKLQMSKEEFLLSPLYQELMNHINKELDGVISNMKMIAKLLEDNNIASLIIKAEKDIINAEAIKDGFSKDFETGRQLLAQRKYEVFSVKKDDREAYDQIRDQVGFLRTRAKNKLKDLYQKYANVDIGEYLIEIGETKKAAETLQNLVLDFHRIFSEKKRKKGVLDFSDIEHLALEILAQEEAAKEYRNKFKYIFIDEYQDSNLVQEALIQKIQRPNNVFMVGDVKQSIYKFRLAEPEIFIEKYNKLNKNLDPCGRKIDLNKNFRSKTPILTGVNKLFSYLMCKDTADMEYDDAAALYKGVVYEGPLEHGLEFHLIDYEKDDEDDLGRVEAEAILVASLIRENKGLAYFDVKSNREKKLDYKDMVILLRSAAGDAEKYKEALEFYGIPAFIDTGNGYYDSLEVSVFLNLLKVIDNKYQDIPLLSILRSAIFTFNMDELAAVRGGSPTDSYMRALEKYADEGEDEKLRLKCENVLDSISRWKKRRRHMPLKDFIWKLMLATDFYYYVGALPGGRQRQANLRALADKALAYESSQGKGLFGFINYIEAVKEKKIATAPVNLLGEGDNVVRIMTVHKSKGLEYPFVILAGLGKQFISEKGRQTSLHKELGLGIRKVDKELTHYKKTLLQKLVDNKVSNEALAEEIRILYVAMTRAQDKLILVGNTKNADKVIEKSLLLDRSGIEGSLNYLEMILPVYGVGEGAPFVNFQMHKSGDLALDRDQEEKVLQTDYKPDVKLGKFVADRFEWIYPFEEATKSKAKYSVSELSKEGVKFRKPARDGRDRLPIGRKLDRKAIDRGNAYHAIIEHLPMDKEYKLIDQIDGTINQLVEDNIITEDEKSLVEVEKIFNFARSDLYKRMQEADELHKEAPFVLIKGEIIIQGIIDAYFKEGDDYVLVDFKSDRDDGSPEREKVLIENYSPQISLYKEALEKLGKHKVKEAYLYLISSNRIIKIE